MGVGSGLGAQFGFGAESTWATPVTVDHFVEFNSETLAYNKTVLQGLGLHAGGLGMRSSRRRVSRKAVAGDVQLDLAYNKMGLLFKHGLGSGSTSTPVQIAATTAYKQVHVLGSTDSMGLTMQVGRPQTDGTVVQPFTYNGCKVTDLEIQVSDNQIATVTLTLDGQNVTTATALAAATYVTSGNGVFSFADAQAGGFTLGGTVTTTAGVSSVASGVNVATLINSFSLKVSHSDKVDRFGLGNAGLKGQQVNNGYASVTGSLGGEFTSRTELYDLFQNDTGTPLHLVLTGAQIASTGQYNTIDILLPALFFDTGQPNVSGPDIVQQSLNYQALDDGTNNQCQVTIISSDTAL